ncbi:hypothetical protein EKD04_011835 [Chloroflexales bacterium ZM16-3]|nr:hypothetical protein [Chloroflexales bacterium ZM16-3]
MPETTRKQRRGRRGRSHKGNSKTHSEDGVKAAQGGHSAAKVTILPEIVITSGDPHQYSADVRETARALNNTAKDAAQDLQLQIIKASEDFKHYATPKISKLDGEITASELLIALVTIPARVVGGEVANKITSSKLWQAIIKKYVDEGIKSMGAAAGKAASNADDARSLQEALDQLILINTDGVLMIANNTDTAFSSLSERLFAHAKDNAPLDDEDQDILVQFFLASPKTIRDGLTRYGLPGQASLKQLYLELYTRLVEAFEVKYIRATSGLTEHIDMYASGKTYQDRAREAAKEAQKKRNKDLGGGE